MISRGHYSARPQPAAMVRVWQPTDGIPVGPPLDLSSQVLGITIHGKVIVVTAAGADILVHQPTLPQPAHQRPAWRSHRIMAYYPVHQPRMTVVVLRSRAADYGSVKVVSAV